MKIRRTTKDVILVIILLIAIATAYLLFLTYESDIVVKAERDYGINIPKATVEYRYEPENEDGEIHGEENDYIILKLEDGDIAGFLTELQSKECVYALEADEVDVDMLWEINNSYQNEGLKDRIALDQLLDVERGVFSYYDQDHKCVIPYRELREKLELESEIYNIQNWTYLLFDTESGILYIREVHI